MFLSEHVTPTLGFVPCAARNIGHFCFLSILNLLHIHDLFSRISRMNIRKGFIMNFIEEKSERNRFERKLDEYNHTMEFIRTLIPIAVLVLQVVILIKII